MDEIATLREIPFDKYPAYAHELIRDRERLDNEFILALLRSAKVPVSGQPSFKEPFYCNRCSPIGPTLRDVDAFLTQNQTLGTVKILRDKKAILQQVISVFPRGKKTLVTALEYYVLETSLGGSYESGVLLLPFPPRPGQNKGRLDLILTQVGGTEPARLSVSIPYLPGPIQEGAYPMDWLRRQPKGNQLVARYQGKETVFPRLKVFWNHVAGRTPNDAFAFLDEKLGSAKGQLSFFGISVDKTIAAWVGPGASLLLLLFFIAHLRHFRSTVEKEREALATYPWVCLFPDALSKAITHLSFLCLPIVNLCLLLRSGSLQEWRGMLRIVLTAATALCSGWAMIEIRALRFMTTKKL